MYLNSRNFRAALIGLNFRSPKPETTTTNLYTYVKGYVVYKGGVYKTFPAVANFILVSQFHLISYHKIS